MTLKLAFKQNRQSPNNTLKKLPIRSPLLEKIQEGLIVLLDAQCFPSQGFVTPALVFGVDAHRMLPAVTAQQPTISVMVVEKGGTGSKFAKHPLRELYLM